MAAITLEIAKEHLDIWLEAEKAVALGQSYTIGSRSLTRANLSEIRKSIQYWKDTVIALENANMQKGRNRITRVVPRDI